MSRTPDPKVAARNQAIINDYIDSLTVPELVLKYGVGTETVRRAIRVARNEAKANGTELPRRRAPRTPNAQVRERNARIIELRNNGVPMREIADTLGVRYELIRVVISVAKKNGVVIRPAVRTPRVKAAPAPILAAAPAEPAANIDAQDYAESNNPYLRMALGAYQPA